MIVFVCECLCMIKYLCTHLSNAMCVQSIDKSIYNQVAQCAQQADVRVSLDASLHRFLNILAAGSFVTLVLNIWWPALYSTTRRCHHPCMLTDYCFDDYMGFGPKERTRGSLWEAPLLRPEANAVFSLDPHFLQPSYLVFNKTNICGKKATRSALGF